jgi:hypothetical protein
VATSSAPVLPPFSAWTKNLQLLVRGSTDDEFDKDFQQLRDNNVSVKMFVGPKELTLMGPQERTETFLFGKEVSNKFQIFNIQKNVFFLGFIVYKDVFSPETKVHLTEFCQKLTGLDLAMNPALPMPKILPDFPPFGFEFNGCDKHSCADEYCKADYEKVQAATK